MGKQENNTLVEMLILDGHLKTSGIIKAFKKVDRGEFIPMEMDEGFRYTDRPLPIGANQTISAPHMVAIMTEALQPKEGDKILEIGTGSGYQAAILSKLCKKVYTIEIVESLVEFAKENLKDYKNVEVIQGDGSLGYEQEAKYDKIIVTAASPAVPEELMQQLKKNGVLAIPVGNQMMQKFILVKNSKPIKEEFICDVVFVPLTGEKGF